jgi:hypothetical protein
MKMRVLSLLALLALCVNSYAADIDLWDYMFSDYGTTEGLTDGIAKFRTYVDPVESNKGIIIKDRRDCFGGDKGMPGEVFFTYGDNIYISYESGGHLVEVSPGIWAWGSQGVGWCEAGDSFRFYETAGAVWCPRYVTPGTYFEIPGYWEFYDNSPTYSDGSKHKKRMSPGIGYVYKPSSVNLGGWLGVRNDVVVVRRYLGSYYENSGAPDFSKYEDYYYDEEYGFVKWTYTEDGGASTVLNSIEIGTWPLWIRWIQTYQNFTTITGSSVDFVAVPYAFETYWNTYITAEQGGGSTVSGDRTQIGPWEILYVYDDNGGYLMDGDSVTIQTDNGINWLVATNGGGTGEIIKADRTQIGIWETFTILKDDVSNSRIITDGDGFHLRSSNDYFMSVEWDYSVRCDRESAYAWETFTLRDQRGFP